jgi:ABC-type Mn2+/Zn2+ transport system permease subunit
MTWDQLLRPFEFQFFVNGLIVATLSGALCGLVGVYVVLKGMSYIGHGLSHAIFGGFAASALLGVNFFLGAGAWGVASALLINGVTRRRAIGSDAAIGVITTASFAIGVVLIKRYGSGGKNPDALLFGQILGVRNGDVVLLAAVAVAVALVVFFLYRPLLFSTFDPEVAEASGVPTARVDALLALVLAATILTTMTVLGVTLVAATLVIPAVVARMLTDSFARMLLLATVIGAVCGFVGMNLSYHLDVPSGPAIVLTGSALFSVVFAVSGRRGLHRVGGVEENTAFSPPPLRNR